MSFHAEKRRVAGAPPPWHARNLPTPSSPLSTVHLLGTESIHATTVLELSDGQCIEQFSESFQASMYIGHEILEAHDACDTTHGAGDSVQPTWQTTSRENPSRRASISLNATAPCDARMYLKACLLHVQVQKNASFRCPRKCQLLRYF